MAAEVGGLALTQAWDAVLASADTPTRARLTNARAMALHESTYLLAVPNETSRERIETRSRSWIEQQLSAHYARPIHLAVSVDPSLEPDLDAANPAPELPLTVSSQGVGVSTTG